jgi:HTH-type transcriptional regulator/antitoxin HigA
VVFNICGNKYRLVVHINYPYRVIYVRFIGTHRQYDAIDVESIYKDIKPIRNEADYEATLAEIQHLMDAKPGTRAGDRLDILVTLVEAYEDKHWQIDPPDPIEEIKIRMEQRGLTRQDLAQVLGSKSRVSEVLSRKRPLTLAMIQRLHKDWGIPAESLIRPTTHSPQRKRPATQAA